MSFTQPRHLNSITVRQKVSHIFVLYPQPFPHSFFKILSCHFSCLFILISCILPFFSSLLEFFCSFASLDTFSLLPSLMFSLWPHLSSLPGHLFLVRCFRSFQSNYVFHHHCLTRACWFSIWCFPLRFF